MRPTKRSFKSSTRCSLSLYCIVSYCIVLFPSPPRQRLETYETKLQVLDSLPSLFVLYCIVSYRIVSYRIVSYCIVLYRIVLFPSLLRQRLETYKTKLQVLDSLLSLFVLYCIVSYRIVSYRTVPYRIVLFPSLPRQRLETYETKLQVLDSLLPLFVHQQELLAEVSRVIAMGDVQSGKASTWYDISAFHFIVALHNCTFWCTCFYWIFQLIFSPNFRIMIEFPPIGYL